MQRLEAAVVARSFGHAGPGNHVNVFEVGNVIDDQEIPNGRFDLLVNTWLPNHLDSTGVRGALG